jgi:hypothetical protein
MAVLTVACLLGIAEFQLDGGQRLLVAAAWLIAIGSLITCATRLLAIARLLRSG